LKRFQAEVVCRPGSGLPAEQQHNNMLVKKKTAQQHSAAGVVDAENPIEISSSYFSSPIHSFSHAAGAAHGDAPVRTCCILHAR
jgi:hypothetical protein